MDKVNLMNNGNIITISDDKMVATLYLVPPEYGEFYSTDEIAFMLKEKGVISGIRNDVIDNIISRKLYYENIEVAYGKEAEGGKDGYFKYFFNTENISYKPKILEDGSVDYLSSNFFEIVKAGQVIAEYVPPTNGKSGFDVTGKFILGKKGKPKAVISGKGFTVSEDRLTYTAVMDGRIQVENDRIIINNILEIKGDVDLNSGNIDFIGDVIVKGDVLSGMEIKTDGSVLVAGHVGAAKITAGTGIVLKSGMQGGDRGELISGKDVKGKFFECCTIKAKGVVEANSLYNTYVEAEGNVKVNGKKGLILGGNTYCHRGIEAYTVGNEAECMTTLVAGYSTEMLYRQVELTKLIDKTKGEVELLDKNLNIFERMEKSKTKDENDARKMKIFRAKVIRTTQLKEYNDERNSLDEDIRESSRAAISTKGTVYRGVTVRINGGRYDVKESIQGVTFRNRGTEIILEGIE